MGLLESKLLTSGPQYPHLPSICMYYAYASSACTMHTCAMNAAVCKAKASVKPLLCQNVSSLRRKLVPCFYGQQGDDSCTGTDPMSACWILCLPELLVSVFQWAVGRNGH